MADKPPKGKRRSRKASTPKPPEQGIEDLAQAAEAAAAETPIEPPPSGDTPPGEVGAEPGARRPRRVTKKGTKAIEDALRELLQMPAVPAAVFGDEWLAEHFTTQGDALANKIAVVSERNPVLRRWCERMLEGESVAVLLMASMLYAGPPLMHFGLLPGGQLLGVPVLRRRQPIPAQHTTPEEAAYGREEPEPIRHGAPPPTSPEYADEEVVPEMHFPDEDVIYEGGENGDGPPVWREQLQG